MIKLNEKNEITEKVIHLMTTTLCNRNCKYCCNKQYDIDTIPTVTDEELKRAEVICLTGGEPFTYSNPDNIAGRLKGKYPNIKAVYVYTNATELCYYLWEGGLIGTNLDGLSVSVKTKKDREMFKIIMHDDEVERLSSNRLYVFDNLIKEDEYIGNFTYIKREWQEDFKPDKNSIFRRI